MKPAVQAALSALETEGRLTPEMVVEAARDESSPLHECFEWNDLKASAAWRIEQARKLIRSVMVEITTHERTISVVRYVHDPATLNGEQGYVTVKQLSHEPENVKRLIAQEFARAQANLARAQDLADVLGAGVKKAVASAEKAVAKVAVKVARAKVHEAQL